MKKYTFLCFLSVLLMGCFIFTNCFSMESEAANSDNTIYPKGDIVLYVYDIECESGVGGYTLEVDYDGDNFDFYRADTNVNYILVYKDNAVGKVKIGAIEDNGNNKNEAVKSVRIAVSFKTLYMLDSRFVAFSGAVKSFTDHMAQTTNDYTFSERFYLFHSSDEYEEYIDQLLNISDSDTDTATEIDIHSDTDSDSETDILSDTDSDSETDILSDTDSDSEIDIHSDTDSDSETDIHSDTDTDSEIDIHSDTDSDSETDIHSDTDSDSEIDIHSDTDSDSETDIHSDTDSDSETDIHSDTDINSEIDKHSDTDTNTDIGNKDTFIYGDVDYDGDVSAGDALLALRASVGLEHFNDTAFILADVDCDRQITSADSLDILRCSVSITVNSKAGEPYKQA